MSRRTNNALPEAFYQGPLPQEDEAETHLEEFVAAWVTPQEPVNETVQDETNPGETEGWSASTRGPKTRLARRRSACNT